MVSPPFSFVLKHGLSMDLTVYRPMYKTESILASSINSTGNAGNVFKKSLLESLKRPIGDLSTTI
jgi:hypothetical protein